ncbi:glycosyl transferase [Oenococcus oeni]|uniref:stealth family protein n=1 Tax=Oenococcus oeni TaxID=1247 RepID=UPI0008F91287|nr:stealth family protein [Oenococcus oeni]OIL68623.1 glycosyl transferase [Oenococcus oeni]OIM47561.1 glycosyl transferase [Oenococcus oeni]OLQ33077.1 glycosyl transferase [Oenococcus oeni]
MIKNKRNDKVIDFVIDWVNGQDTSWQAKRAKYLENKEDASSARFRDWGFLKYWFRSVEENAPWVNKIYLIADNQKPDFLNLNSEKVKIVDHKDFIPNNFLPLFNSNAIEIGIHNIPGLSEQFVFFNDDMFINKKVSPTDFFKNGFPRDSGVMSPQFPIENSVTHNTTNSMEIINKYFTRNSILKSHFFKVFNWKYGIDNIRTLTTLPWKVAMGFYDNHIPISFLKSTFEDVWSKEGKLLSRNFEYRFRSKLDYSVWIMRYFQLASGKFLPRSTNFGKYYNIGKQTKQIINDIRTKKHSLIVLNDQQDIQNFELERDNIISVFESSFPKKSSFEV